MKELTEYRQKLLDRFAAAAAEFREACLAVKRPFDPLEPGGWSLHQVAVHARDIDKLVYGLRARRTLSEDNPNFPNFDGEAYMAEHYNAQEFVGRVVGRAGQEYPRAGHGIAEHTGRGMVARLGA